MYTSSTRSKTTHLGKKMESSWLLHTLYVCLLAGLNRDATGRESKANVFVTRTSYGKVRGMKVTSYYGDVIQFLGIPYARPPIGVDRFQQPHPPYPWTGDRDAFSFGSSCIQQGFDQTNITGSEDCLYLNIYIPTNVDISSQLLSVMVWIHGGGYMYGASSQYDGSGLANKGVVVVTINYRLNVFGFLSTEDDVIPGNFGMMDQIMALKWVQQNIADFGGDPAKVTIFGENAGASSVSLLVLSPLAKGLFTRAIMESGSALSPWTITHPATSVAPRLVSQFVGSTVKCMGMNSVSLLDCLRKIDPHDLLKAGMSIEAVINSNNIIFKPRVENTFGFLPDLPIKLLSAGQFNPVDTMHGFNAEEMGFSLGDVNYSAMSVGNFRDIILGNFTNLLLGSLKSFSVPDKDQFVKDAMDVYKINNTSSPDFIRDQAIQASSNLAFAGPTMSEIKLLASRSNTSQSSPGSTRYLYRFQYRPTFSVRPPWIHLVHGEELFFVFGLDLVKKLSSNVSIVLSEKDKEISNQVMTWSEKDKEISNQVMTWWTNFAKTGDPNLADAASSFGNWTPYTKFSDSLMSIDTNSTMTEYGMPEVVDLSMKLIKKIDTALDLGSWIVG